LSVKQERVLDLLLSGESQADAGRKTGVNQATISTWARHDPVFKAAFAAGRADRRAAVMSQLDGAGGVAMRALVKLAKGGKGVPAFVQRQAASDLLDRCGVKSADKVEITVDDLRSKSEDELLAIIAGNATRRESGDTAEA
jgi:hypothetical protein